MSDVFETVVKSNGLDLFVSIFFVLVSTLMLYDFVKRFSKDFSVSYRISVLGLPRSGKTALISAMYAEMFSDNNLKINPVGSETITHVNKLIENLDSGRPIPPTTEKDVFVFRFLFYVRSIFPQKVRFEGEVVDFPGEMTHRLLDSSKDGTLQDDIGIFGKQFYSWIISSRSVIFVIDCGELLRDLSDEYVIKMTSEIRAAWQLLQDESSLSFRPGSKKIALVFTKVDIARVLAEGGRELALDKLLFDDPLVNDLSKFDRKYGAEIKIFKEMTLFKFKDLISYFRGREAQFKVFFVSSYAKSELGRYGVKDLLDYILPTNRSTKVRWLIRDPSRILTRTDSN